jgi:hypothetical protein
MNNGSGSGFKVLARSTAKAMVILRLSGLSRFSETSMVPHCAAVGSLGILHSTSVSVWGSGLLSAHPVSNAKVGAIKATTRFK